MTRTELKELKRLYNSFGDPKKKMQGKAFRMIDEKLDEINKKHQISEEADISYVAQTMKQKFEGIAKANPLYGRCAIAASKCIIETFPFSELMKIVQENNLDTIEKAVKYLKQNLSFKPIRTIDIEAAVDMLGAMR